MKEAVIGQLFFFFASVLFGSILLLGYDIMRGFRRVWIHHCFFVMLEDMIFWFLSGVASFRFLCWYNQGQLRGFFFFGLGIGMIFYYKKISIYTVKISSFLFEKIRNSIVWSFQKIAAPFVHIRIRIRWKLKREKNDIKMVLRRANKRGDQSEKKKEI